MPLNLLQALEEVMPLKKEDLRHHSIILDRETNLPVVAVWFRDQHMMVRLDENDLKSDPRDLAARIFEFCLNPRTLSGDQVD